MQLLLFLISRSNIKHHKLQHVPHSTRSASLVSSAAARGHLPLSLYLYFSRTLIVVLVCSVKYWMLQWPSIAGWPKLSMMTRMSCTALPTIAGSVAQVWNTLPATDFARASDVIALYSQWLTTRNHVPNSSATSRCVAVGSEAIMLQNNRRKVPSTTDTVRKIHNFSWKANNERPAQLLHHCHFQHASLKLHSVTCWQQLPEWSILHHYRFIKNNLRPHDPGAMGHSGDLLQSSCKNAAKNLALALSPIRIMCQNRQNHCACLVELKNGWLSYTALLQRKQTATS